MPGEINDSAENGGECLGHEAPEGNAVADAGPGNDDLFGDGRSGLYGDDDDDVIMEVHGHSDGMPVEDAGTDHQEPEPAVPKPPTDHKEPEPAVAEPPTQTDSELPGQHTDPPSRSLATPCRASAETPQVPETPKSAPSLSSETPTSQALTPTVLECDSPSSVPSIGDTSAKKPVPDHLRISEAAADARKGRVFQPSMRTGKFKVSDSILNQYKKNGKSRKSLMKLFETCGYDKDRALQSTNVKP